MPSVPKTLRNEQIMRLLTEGHTYREISAVFKLDVKTVWEIVQRERLKVAEKVGAEK